MALRFISLTDKKDREHRYLTIELDGTSDWQAELAAEFKALRTATAIPLTKVRLDGIQVLNVEEIQRRLSRATIPTRRGGNFDVVRSDFGETLAYLILEQEFGSQFSYKSVRDRETINLPGRGIDAIGVEKNGKLTIVLAETKVSGQDSPPHVVDRNEDSLRNQHSGHMRDHEETSRKVWDVARRADTEELQNLLIAAAHWFEEKNWDHLNVVACCVLVRPREKYRETDFGSFQSTPQDFNPARVRFLVICIPSGMGTDVDDVVKTWYKLVTGEGVA